MALARTVLGTFDFSDTTSSASHSGTCDLGTVATGDLIILYAAGTVYATPGTPFTDPVPPFLATPSKSSGTATIGTVTDVKRAETTTQNTAFAIAWRFAVTAGGTLVISVADSGEWTYGFWILAEQWTGHDTTTPIGSTVSDNETASGSFSPSSQTLGVAPASGDYVMVWVDADTDAGSGKGWTPGSGFTESTEVGASTNDYVEANLSYRTGSTSTTVNWPTDTAGGPTRYSCAGIGFVVKVSADTGVTGTSAQTLAAATSSASGAFGPSGTSAQTLAAATSTASGWASVVGTIAVTLAAATSAATGSLIVTGTSAQTLAAATSTASGTLTISGTSAQTLAAATSIATGWTTVTGTSAQTLAAATSDAWATRDPFAAAVSGNDRYIVDHFGDPWPLLGDAGWSLFGMLTPGELDTYFDGLATHGINTVLCNLIDNAFNTNAPGNYNGDDPYTGTMFQSATGSAYWTWCDTVITEAAQRGITLLICPAYAGYDDTQGLGAEIVAASNAQIQAYGEFIGARYRTRPNIVWVIGGDRPSPSATLLERYGYLATGIRNYDTVHLMTGHTGPEALADDYFSDPSWLDVNNVYTYDATIAETVDNGWAASPTRPFFYVEGRYEQETGWSRQLLRHQAWASFCVGAVGHVMGNNPRWHFEAGGLYSYTGTWEESLDDAGGALDDATIDFSRFTSFVSSLSWAATVPDTADTFLTSGESTGATRAAARFSGDLAILYMPTSREIQVDLTEFSGSWTSCRVRKYDPTTGGYSDVGTYATTGTQTISAPGNNASGDSDWALLFEGLNAVTGTSAQTLAAATSAATGNTTATGTSAQTLAAATSTAAGTLIFTGTSAQTLADATSTATGSFTALGEVSGTSAVTLAAATSTASGSFGPSGTSAQTLADATSTASGWVPVTGFSAQTLAAATSTAAGTAAGVTVADPNPGRPIQSRDPGPIKSSDPGPV